MVACQSPPRRRETVEITVISYELPASQPQGFPSGCYHHVTAPMNRLIKSGPSLRTPGRSEAVKVTELTMIRENDGRLPRAQKEARGLLP